MKIVKTFSDQQGFLVIKVPQPFNKIRYVIDDILVILKRYGDYKIVGFGLAQQPKDSSCINFYTNLPYSIYSQKKN